MEPTPKNSRNQYVQQVRQVVEQRLGRVAEAIKEALPGHIIASSEEKVRDLFAVGV